MSKKDRSLANSRDEAKKIYYQRKEINRLQQENQQLKEQLENASKNYTKYIQERDNVLDEIREVIIELRNIIYNSDYKDFGLSREQYKDRFIHLFEILDKVKE